MALERRDVERTARRPDPPGDGREGPQGRSARARRPGRARRERRDPPGQRELRRRPSPHPRRQLRRPARRGRRRAHPVHGELRRGRRHRDADRDWKRPGAASASSSSTRSTPRRWLAPPRSARSRCSARVPHPSGSCRSCSSGARVACCSTKRAGTGSKPISSRRTGRCSRDASASSSRHRSITLVDDGSYAREWGTFAIDDEGAPAQRNVLIEDGVLTDYMWDLLRARKEGRAEQRERPARDLPAPADGAHDEHVPARRARRPRGDHPRHAVRSLLRRARRRTGEHRDRRLRVRDHRGRT